MSYLILIWQIFEDEVKFSNAMNFLLFFYADVGERFCHRLSILIVLETILFVWPFSLLFMMQTIFKSFLLLSSSLSENKILVPNAFTQLNPPINLFSKSWQDYENFTFFSMHSTSKWTCLIEISWIKFNLFI